MTRLTKQGVRNLDPAGHDGRKRHACRHWFAGPDVVIGTRLEADEHSHGEVLEVPVYGQRCAWCSAAEEVR